MQLANSLVVGAVAGAGASSTVVDIYTRRVPNALTLGIALVGIAMAAMRATSLGLAGAFEGLAVGLLLMLPGHIIGATGAGDVKLFAALGTLLGPKGIGMAFMYTALAGASLAVVIAYRRRRLAATLDRVVSLVRSGGANATEIEQPQEHNRFAYAPAIALGTFAAALGL